jgi:hypothetical protein
MQLKFKQGGFIDAVRAYKKRKQKGQEQMDIELARMEEEIQRAKNDTLYNMELV